MNTKSTWVWFTLAAILFAAVLGVEKYWRQPPPAVVPVLPNFHAAAVNSVQYTPPGQLEIRADRTNGVWQLVKPIVYPAQKAGLEALLATLERLAPLQTISSAELRSHTNVDEEFGFQNRRMLTLQSDRDTRPLQFGNRTAPGDGVYVRVVGGESVFVVDAGLLDLLPGKPDDWRDTALLDLPPAAFDRLTVSNAAAVVALAQGGTNQPWRLTFPIPARADNERLLAALQQLNATRVRQFVTDQPSADPESFGFLTPELTLTFARDTNVLTTLQFGKSPTNDSTLIYVRRAGQPTICTVERQALQPWLISLNEFRDPHLLSTLPAVTEVEFSGPDPFTLQVSPTNTWQLKGSPLPVDQELVTNLLLTLLAAPIQQYKDSITAEDLSRYGLATPQRVLRLFVASAGTNALAAELAFGAPTTNGLVYVRRADENPVYALRNTDYGKLAVADWQLRERRLWRFAETNAVRMLLRRGGHQLDLRRAGANAWASVPPSGNINGSEVENIIKQFAALNAVTWLGHGDASRATFGITTNSLQVDIELKNGTRYQVEFGRPTPDGYPVAALKLEGESWCFEFPLMLYKYMEFALLNAGAFPP
ncbi:MAG TPA: DUF4340 domain-containing protein [Verrucomicrobiota bacterium]|nr:DUF4340 domain-containing protein [Verrucomicrobiota bacterium]HNT14486.1 DUF4340 domain-containing protein [Verrucomicrobiota bacterium]